MSAHLTRHHGISPKRKGLCRPMDTSSNSSSMVTNSSGPSSSTSGSSSMGQLRMTECGFKMRQLNMYGRNSPRFKLITQKIGKYQLYNLPDQGRLNSILGSGKTVWYTL